jgi:hypothetical protein
MILSPWLTTSVRHTAKNGAAPTEAAPCSRPAAWGDPAGAESAAGADYILDDDRSFFLIYVLLPMGCRRAPTLTGSVGLCRLAVEGESYRFFCCNRRAFNESDQAPVSRSGSPELMAVSSVAQQRSRVSGAGASLDYSAHAGGCGLRY